MNNAVKYFFFSSSFGKRLELFLCIMYRFYVEKISCSKCFLETVFIGFADACVSKFKQRIVLLRVDSAVQSHVMIAM